MGTDRGSQPGPRLALAQVSCLCKVSFDVLHAIDGVHDWHFVGAGVVVDAAAGLVAVDRNTVVASLGECAVAFGAGHGRFDVASTWAFPIGRNALWVRPER